MNAFPRGLGPRIVLILAAALTLFPDTARSRRPLADHTPREVIVKFREEVPPFETDRLCLDLGAIPIAEMKSIRAGLFRLSSLTVEEAMSMAAGNPAIEYIEPNYTVRLVAVPDDELFPRQWSLRNTGQTGGTAGADISAVDAWDVTTGSPEVVIGIVDTGIDYTHPDLAANIWINEGEIPDNGIDDDGNGYVDDVRGWNFLAGTNDPMDDNGHGTHVAGTAGAIGNNGAGIAGVAWGVRLMPLKFLSNAGSGSVAGAVEALEYAIRMGARITNNSWSTGAYSQSLFDAVAATEAAEQLFVAASGNQGTNIDQNPVYPSALPFDNVVSVAATDPDDDLASFSNTGALAVDLAAPGVVILSTFPGNQYGLLSGTSMASPHVAGALGLILSRVPDIPAIEAKELLLATVDPVPGLKAKTVSGGRLNAFLPVADPDSIAPAPVVDLRIVDQGSDWIEVAWTATGDDGNQGTARRYDLRYAREDFDEESFGYARRVAGLERPGPPGTPEQVRILGLEFRTDYVFGIVVQDELGNRSALGPPARARTLGPPTLRVNPDRIEAALRAGESLDVSLAVDNAGEGTLDFFTLPERILVGEPEPGIVVPGRYRLLDFGGPDAAGYRWEDSNESGVEFTWRDRSAEGTPVHFDDDDAVSAPRPLRFSFPFYTERYDSVRISANGWLSFTDGSRVIPNLPLPSTGAPGALVSPFWDDLEPSRGSVVTVAESDRFIVQFTDVMRFGGGGPYTFQAVLHLDGTVDFLYRAMGRPDSLATVGIQSADGRRGLTVAHRRDYVRDDLLVRIARIPTWVEASAETATVRVGEPPVPLALRLDTSGLLQEGEYQARLRIGSNDPVSPVTEVPIQLTLTGAPDLAVLLDTLDFGPVLVGGERELALTLENRGSRRLLVDGVRVEGAAFEVGDIPAVLEPGEGRALAVTFRPDEAGPFGGTVTVDSNDPDTPARVVALRGEAVEPPTIAVEPGSLSATLAVGQNAAREVTVRNTGAGPLEVWIETRQAPRPEPRSGPAMILAKGAGDPRAGILGTGGPDAFGHIWRDHRDPQGPPFRWIDVSGTGTPLVPETSDEGVYSVALPFSMPFYGAAYDSLHVAVNGYATLTRSPSMFSNEPLPSPGAPGNLIAAFWDDLVVDPSRGGQIYLESRADRVVVQYDRVDRFLAPGDPFTFQIQLAPDGSILFLYRETGTFRTSATVGIQNAAADDGLLVAFNGPYVRAGTAVRITPIEWLRVAPSAVSLEPGGSAPIQVDLVTGDLLDGRYRGSIILASNDPDRSRVEVPVDLSVSGEPDLVLPTSVEFDLTYLGFPRVQTVLLDNRGTAPLAVTDLRTTGPFALCCEPVGTPITVIPGGQVALQVSFSPTGVGPATGTLRVATDDPRRPELTAALTGTGAVAPAATVEAGPLDVILPTGATDRREIRITNAGGSDLRVAVRAAGGLVPEPAVIAGAPPAKGMDGDAAILGGGGPDRFGYRWQDSGDPAGPEFAWLDVREAGEPLFRERIDDEPVGPLPLPFPVPFYGDLVQEVTVSPDGWLSFQPAKPAFGNTALPSADAPPALLAALWDDFVVDPPAGGQVWMWSDPDRVVFQFDRLVRFRDEAGGEFTFQVHITREGTFLIQVLRLGTTTESATIGIQNPARDDGLTVVADAAYLAPRLAVRISPGPPWLTAEPSTAVLAPGETLPVRIGFDPGRLLSGTYPGSIRVISNDPVRPEQGTPATLRVAGVPRLSVEPTALDFGEIFFGYPDTQDVRVTNVGTDVLRLNTRTSGPYRADPSTLTLEPFRAGAVTVVFDPTRGPGDEGSEDSDSGSSGKSGSSGESGSSGKSGGSGKSGASGLSERSDRWIAPGRGTGSGGRLVLEGNDPGSPHVVALTGTGLEPPRIRVAPDSVVVEVAPGGSAAGRIMVRNVGRGDLTFRVVASARNTPAALAPIPVADLAKGEPDERVGITGRGGPDAFGYRWTDSDEPGGPEFDWVEIAPTGTPVFPEGADDVNLGPFPIGFGMPFYGRTFTEFRICSNGFVSTTSRSSRFINEPFPRDFFNTPANVIAAFWDDLVVDPRDSSQVYYETVGDRLVVQYQNIRRFSPTSGDLYTFQIQMAPDGRILVLYRTLGNGLSSATVGIQNEERDDGLTVTFNEPYPRPGLALPFRPPIPWLSTEEGERMLSPGDKARIPFRIDATDLQPGTYRGRFTVRSNDPRFPGVEIPVVLRVPGPPANPADPDPTPTLASPGVRAKLLNTSPNPFRSSTRLGFTLPAPGPVRVEIFDVRGRRVRILQDGPLPAGAHELSWDGADGTDRNAASGIYFLRLTSPFLDQTRRVFKIR